MTSIAIGDSKTFGGQYVEQFADMRGGPEWLAARRDNAYKRFTELGFPTRKDEEWRFTNVSQLADTLFVRPGRADFPLSSSEIANYTFKGLSGVEVVMVNGRYEPSLSNVSALPPRVFLGSLSEALAHDGTFLEENLAVHANSDSNAFLALNTAFLADAVVLDIPRGIVVDVPIHILHVSQSGAEPTVSHPRFIARFGAHSQSTVIESYIGDKGAVYFTNAATELIVADSAVVDHYKVQRESLNAFHVATTQVVAGPSTAFTSHSLTFGGHFVRNDINAMLVGERSETTLNGLYLGSGNQLVDNHTSIDHAVPNCASHEIYKGILSGRARGVFNGKIYVHQDAQKTDAKQTNKTLLLSDEAQINTKPQLEIFADDVRCTHGATIGQLDDEGLFYLRSRGIGKKQAQSILVYAFASDIVSRIKVEPVRAQLDRVLLKERALEESD